MTAGAPGRAQQGLRVLDEAMRLLDLLQAQPGQAGEAGPDAGASGQHRGGECRVCPVCRGVALLREANPEALARMTRAVADLAVAFGDVLAGPDRSAAGPEPEPPAPRPAVLRIDVAD